MSRLLSAFVLLLPTTLLGSSVGPNIVAPCAAAVTVNGRTCCKLSTKGKAWGDNCISASSTCRKGPGCACNAGETRQTRNPESRPRDIPRAQGVRRVEATRTRTPHSTPAAVTAVLREGRCTVRSVGDGDTFTCSNGARVRLLLIDTPEKAQEPYGEQARQALRALIPVGSSARLETDVDPQDRYGRILAYVYTADGRMANEEMARKGYALSLTYPPNVRHVERIRAAVSEARSARRGLHASSAFACTPRDFRAGRCR